MNFEKKIASYIEDDENNFVIWANKLGLQNLSEIHVDTYI